MPIPIFTGLSPNPTFEEVATKVNVIVQQLRELLLTLDDYNFDKITANVMDVQQLSAIAADLGTIVAGTIYGNYIATTQGAVYPKAEMSNTNNLFSAYSDADNYVQIKPNSGSGPGAVWHEASGFNAYESFVAGSGYLLATFAGRSIALQSAAAINLTVGTNLKINNVTTTSGTINYVKNVVSGTPTFGTITVNNGLITAFT